MPFELHLDPSGVPVLDFVVPAQFRQAGPAWAWLRNQSNVDGGGDTVELPVEAQRAVVGVPQALVRRHSRSLRGRTRVAEGRQ
jgi:hypothetical protein